jgi:predicted MFS family arabinose efflux permease
LANVGGMAIHNATAAPLALGRTPTAYWLAWVATVSFFAGFYALLVPLPRYLAEAGMPDWQIGLVLGAFGVASLVGRPVAGVAADRLGPRAVMLVGSAALAIGALAVPATSGLAALFALRVLQAIGYVAFTTAGTALVVALVAPEERGRRLAVFGAAANLAITVTPALVSLLLEIAPVWTGLLAAGLLALLGGLLASRLPPTSTAGASIAWSVPRRLWPPMAASALLGAGFVAFFQFAPILADRRAISPGLLYLTYGLAIIATRLVGGRLVDRFDVGRVVALAAGLTALGHALIAATSSAAPLLVAPLLIAAGGGLFHPALIAHHAALLPGAPGRASAAFYLAFDLGIGAGSWLFGAALELAGLSGLYWTAAALAAAVLPLTPTLTRGDARARA